MISSRRVNALRHVTYRELDPWKPLDEIVLLPIGKRIRYIRTNLTFQETPAGRRFPYLTLDEFAAATGAKDRHRPIGWEKGQRPRDYAEAIAELTPYPAAAVGGAGAEELFADTVAALLRELRAEMEEQQVTQLRVLRALDDAGIALPAPEEDPRSQPVEPRAAADSPRKKGR